MKTGTIAPFLVGAVIGCGSDPCERYCNALADCGGISTRECVDSCKATLESGGKDGQTDCEAVWEGAGTCIEDNTCADYEGACANELSQTDLCE